MTALLATGCAYLGGAAAQASAVRSQAVRIDGATTAGFTEEALAAAAGGLDASALAVARRHDPYLVAGGAQRDRQAERLTARLEALRDKSVKSSEAGALDASRDLECLTQAAYYEARGEGRDGMRAVAQVVLNRARNAAFPQSVCGVVYQGAGRKSGCQFSFTCDGSMRATVNRAAWNRARAVAAASLSGAVYAPVGSATHFHTTGVSPGWRSALVRVGQVGDHIFYRADGRRPIEQARYQVRRPRAEDRLAEAARDDRLAAAPTPYLTVAGPAEGGAATAAPAVVREPPSQAAPAPQPAV